jgi:hypothetical protein
MPKGCFCIPPNNWCYFNDHDTGTIYADAFPVCLHGDGEFFSTPKSPSLSPSLCVYLSVYLSHLSICLALPLPSA